MSSTFFWGIIYLTPLAVLRRLETEVVIYRMAQWKLKANYPDQGASEGFFAVALEQARTSPELRNRIHNRYVGFAAQFEVLQNEPLPHQIAKVSEFLQEWKSVGPKLFPNDSPKKDAI